jgi:hypothetical protein
MQKYEESDSDPDVGASWAKDYPVTVMQFLLYLYHNHVDFLPLSMSSEFLTALASTLFPCKATSEFSSEIMSPVEDFKVSISTQSSNAKLLLCSSISYI